ncbi:hypothetical protein KJ682_03580 [bacterium]|nr:hypothetical protein [bacterium]
MPIDPALIEITSYDGPGYRPLVDFQAWRVAVLNFIPDLLPENLTTMQRHDETDEVFVLLGGRCILFVGDGSGREDAGAVHAVDLEPLKLYNVKRGVWHTHTLDAEGSVLVIENRDTTTANSPTCPLTDAQQGSIREQVRRQWGEG